MNTTTMAAVSNRPGKPPQLHELLDHLGRLLQYPEAENHDHLADIPGLDPGGLEALAPDECEELYTATFDVNPRCVPYVSIHLFGEENFKRGEFMAALHHQYETRGFDPGRELPDHIGVLLCYAATLAEPDRRELVEFCILGPLAKLVAALDGDHPYRPVLTAADGILRAAYPGMRPALSPLEQMRQHGICPSATPGGCSCGPVDDGAPASAGTLESHDVRITPTEVGAPYAPSF